MNAEEKVVAPDHNLPRDMLLGSIASSIACVFSNPLEVLKTRLQLQGELMSRNAEALTRTYTGMGDAFVKVLKDEGIRGLQGGLTAGILYQSVMNGIRLGAYEYINTHLRKFDAHDSYFFLKNMAVAGTVGGIGAWVGNPFFLVKVRLQTANRSFMATPGAAAASVEGITAPGTSPSRVVGVQYNYRGVFDGMRQIVRVHGIKGLFHGATAASIRVAVGSGTQIASYETIKLNLGHLTGLSGSLLHMCSSSMSAAVVAVAMNPFDVVTTRLYNNTRLYNGAIHCFLQILRIEGVRGFFKGVFPHYLRLAPHTILTFVIWERLKKLVKG